MALIAATQPTVAGVVWTPVAVSASDTIAAADLGGNGAYLIVINGGGSPDTVTIVDSSFTPASSAAINPTVTVANGTTKAIFIPQDTVNLTSLVTTIQHSFTTSVTCVLLRQY